MTSSIDTQSSINTHDDNNNNNNNNTTDPVTWWLALDLLDRTSLAFNYNLNPKDTPKYDILLDMINKSAKHNNVKSTNDRSQSPNINNNDSTIQSEQSQQQQQQQSNNADDSTIETTSHQTQTDVTDLVSAAVLYNYGSNNNLSNSVNNNDNDDNNDNDNDNNTTTQDQSISTVDASTTTHDYIASGGKKELSINVALANGDIDNNNNPITFSNIGVNTNNNLDNTLPPLPTHTNSSLHSNTMTPLNQQQQLQLQLQPQSYNYLNFSPAFRTPHFMSPAGYSFNSSPFNYRQTNRSSLYNNNISSPALSSNAIHHDIHNHNDNNITNNGSLINRPNSNISADKVDFSQQTDQLRSQILSPLPTLTPYHSLSHRGTSASNDLPPAHMLSPLKSTIGTQSYSYSLFSPAARTSVMSTSSNSSTSHSSGSSGSVSTMNNNTGNGMLFSPPAIASVSLFSPQSMIVPTPHNNAGTAAASSGLSNMANARKRVFNFQTDSTMAYSTSFNSPTKVLQDAAAIARAQNNHDNNNNNNIVTNIHHIVTDKDTAGVLNELSNTNNNDMKIGNTNTDDNNNNDINIDDNDDNEYSDSELSSSMNLSPLNNNNKQENNSQQQQSNNTANNDKHDIKPKRSTPVKSNNRTQQQSSNHNNVARQVNTVHNTTDSVTTCRCKKSKCLKLYCECFARRGYCGPSCQCTDCHNDNTHSHNIEREKAITSLLERDPSAFFRQNDVVNNSDSNNNIIQHPKGCHCKKSECQKKYCECYQAKIPCSSACKCTVCKNGKHDNLHNHIDNNAVDNNKVTVKKQKTTINTNSDNNNNNNANNNINYHSINNMQPSFNTIQDNNIFNSVPSLLSPAMMIDNIHQSLSSPTAPQSSTTAAGGASAPIHTSLYHPNSGGQPNHQQHQYMHQQQQHNQQQQQQQNQHTHARLRLQNKRTTTPDNMSYKPSIASEIDSTYKQTLAAHH